MSECAQCGSPAIELVEQGGATDHGSFFEKYECADCGAGGTIRGDASKPKLWSKVGTVFQSEWGENLD